MRLPRVFRTSSFRLTLLYAALTLVSYIVLFGIVSWSTDYFMQRQIDASVAGELTEIQAEAQGADLRQLREVVHALNSRSPDYFYLLQDASGRVLAGNLPATEPVTGVRQWPGPAGPRRGAFNGIRGRGLTVGDGAYLFVGLSTAQLHDMQKVLERAFLWGLALAMLLALAGGAAMSLSVLRRIEAVSQTSRDIVSGDLQRRIADRGSGDEFDHLAASLNAMLNRIQTLMEGLRQVSNDIAHDLRTPLTRLRQRLELAQRHGNAGAVLAQALHDIDSILETFGALLRIAQIEGGTRKGGFTELDLGELLRTVTEVYQPSLEEKDQTLALTIDADLRVMGDRELLTQMFANLLENAIRHCPPNARVELRAQRRGAVVEVSIADNGPGIPAEFRRKVLQRFFRLEASRSTPGNGLGLSLADAIARLHDSELVLSDHNPGLRASVLLETPKG